MGFKDSPAFRIGSVPVVLGGLIEEAEVADRGLHASIDRGVDRLELGTKRSLFERDAAELLTQLFAVVGTVGGKIQEIFFLHGELPELLLVAGPLRALGGLFVIDKLLELSTQLIDLARLEHDLLHGCVNGGLDVADWERSCCASNIQTTVADEIVVFSAVAARSREDELPSEPSIVTLLAGEQAAQIVGVDPIALRASRPELEHVLDTSERLERDKRLMVSRIEVTFIADVSRVVRISEQVGHLIFREHLLCPSAARPGREALLLQFRPEACDGILARGVCAEGPADEWRSYWVDADAVDQVAVDILADVQIPNRRAADRTAPLDLVEHLVADVFAALANLELIEDVGDALHGLGVIALAEVLID